MEKLKNLDFFDACRKVTGTKRRLRHKKGEWASVELSNVGFAGSCYLQGIKLSWWPSPEEQDEKAWEVEPEEIIVWGACGSNGASYLYQDKPTLCQDATVWLTGGDYTQLEKTNLFPKDKPQKLKLTPVEEEC